LGKRIEEGVNSLSGSEKRVLRSEESLPNARTTLQKGERDFASEVSAKNIHKQVPESQRNTNKKGERDSQRGDV